MLTAAGLGEDSNRVVQQNANMRRRIVTAQRDSWHVSHAL
jgi:hypothetical protein